MQPYHQDPWLTVYQGDCREVMAAMEPESVHCVVTSPPYWGLRDYGTATWIGGDEGCDHIPRRWDGPKQTQGAQSGHASGADRLSRNACLCGALRQDSQLGLEPTPEEYVSNMVAVFRGVRRVLRKDGTVWLNLGDSYATTTSGTGARGGSFASERAQCQGERVRTVIPPGLKPKDLVGIPWRVAFALQADGWYLRSDIIWAKPNPMPESVTDRPTKAHEYLFLLSKSPRYYYDADAVREPHNENTMATTGRAIERGGGRQVVQMAEKPERGEGDGKPLFGERWLNPAGRNLRSVWSIATQPYPGAHFATFPEALVEPCVKAGTSERGVCPECGAPWVREVEREFVKTRSDSHPTDHVDGAGYDAGSNLTHPLVYGRYDVTTTGWRRSCTHYAIPRPAVVLDPFAGSGTTGRVAQRLGRRAVLIDLSGEYLTQAMRRNQDIPLGLVSDG